MVSGGSRVRSKIALRVIESAGLKISLDWAKIRYPVAKAFVGSSPTPRTLTEIYALFYWNRMMSLGIV